MDLWSLGSLKAGARPGEARPGAAPIESLAHITKRPRDSYLCVELPFGRDRGLREQYVSFRGQLRVGKLLEELDAFAGIIAYRHCDDGDPDTELPTLVTASTDRVDLVTYPLSSEQDLQMRGMVTYVGASSLNIDIDFCTVPSTPGEAPRPIMLASTTFVARNARTGRALPVPRLRPESALETRLYEAGKLASEVRKTARGRGLDRSPPTPQELAMVHGLFQERSARGGGWNGGMFLGGTPHSLPPAASVSGAPSSASSDASCRGSGTALSAVIQASPVVTTMEETVLTSTELTMPQDRNIHGKVFGGWLMRRAYETAWAAGWKATGAFPKFLALDDITFQHPVEVGSIVRLDAALTYSLGPPSKTYGVSVRATMSRPTETRDAELRAGRVTNTFHFIFYTPEPSLLPRVYPRTYGEAMQWIESHRRHEVGRAAAERRKVEGVAVRFE